MLINGKKSLYEEFDIWHERCKLEANYDPTRFFTERYEVVPSPWQFEEFFSNYELWKTCEVLYRRSNRLEQRIDSLEGEDDD